MLKAVNASLSFMTTNEKFNWFLLVGIRATLSFLDLIGIMAIGFVISSTAIFLTSGSDPSRMVEIAGLTLPAVNAETLPWVGFAVLALFLVKALLSVILTKKAAFFVAKVEARAAKTIAQISFGGDLGNARKRSREEIMYAIQAGSPSAFNGLLNAANAFITEAMLFVIICMGFVFVDPFSTLAAILYFGIIAFIIQFFVGSLMNRAGEITARSSVQANTAISDLMSVFRELLVLGKRDKYINDIYESRVSAADSQAKTYYLSGMPRYVIEAALLVGVALFVMAQALSGDIVKSAATIGVFLSGGFRLTASLLPLQSALLTIKSLIPSAGTAHDILKLRAKSPIEPLSAETVLGDIDDLGPIGVDFKNVSFTYPEASKAALSDISFSIEPGTQVALIGPSGAGKSTIADLLCLVLTPDSGSIDITCSNKSSSSPKDFKGRVSYVPQKPGVVSGTIADNVALAVGTSRMDRNAVVEAMRLAHLSALLRDLPEGIDTHLGKLQDGLSGGQMQRLGLARAIYSEPGLLVMDEATSALDAESESEIQKALNDMRGNVTVVLIAHRLNTIQHADMVLLIDEGRVTDSGTLKELILRNPSVERVIDLMTVEKI
jgi:ABC-type multidrug transport system fused ATPase/permease subunit